MKLIGTKEMPAFFGRLKEAACLGEADAYYTADGFCAVNRSVADMLIGKGIAALPGDSGRALECRLFFDDWYFYAVSAPRGDVYSLFKMREQEFDAEMGLYADGDAPGVTVSFISFRTEVLETCLADPTEENRRQLAREINRVVARRRQQHDPRLKDYFLRPEAEGSYLVAELYVRYIASTAVEGKIAVPKRYAEIWRQVCSGAAGRKEQRLPQFIAENNRAAGAAVCDHAYIRVADSMQLSGFEKLAILATHTGNVSYHSFAAEVRFHAIFLAGWAKIPIPFVGKSPYDSAIRADMSVDDAEFTGPEPYYRLNSGLVMAQAACHQDADTYGF